MISRVLYIPGGAGFLPSTVCLESWSKLPMYNPQKYPKIQSQIGSAIYFKSFKGIQRCFVSAGGSRNDPAGFSVLFGVGWRGEGDDITLAMADRFWQN